MTRIKEITQRKENALADLISVQGRISELREILKYRTVQQEEVSLSWGQLLDDNCTLEAENSKLQAQIDTIELSKTTQHQQLVDERNTFLIQQDAVQEIQVNNETLQEELSTLEAELESVKSKNEESMQSLVTMHIESEIEKRFVLVTISLTIIRLEKRKGVLRSRNAQEIMQMHNKINEADEAFRIEVKKSNEVFQKEKVYSTLIYLMKTRVPWN